MKEYTSGNLGLAALKAKWKKVKAAPVEKYKGKATDDNLTSVVSNDGELETSKLLPKTKPLTEYNKPKNKELEKALKKMRKK